MSWSASFSPPPCVSADPTVEALEESAGFLMGHITSFHFQVPFYINTAAPCGELGACVLKQRMDLSGFKFHDCIAEISWVGRGSPMLRSWEA